MSPEATVPALAAVLAGAAGLYLSAPRQSILARPLPPLAGRGAGAALLLFAWAWWSREASVAAAFFMVLTGTMAAFVALPVVAAALFRRKV